METVFFREREGDDGEDDSGEDARNNNTLTKRLTGSWNTEFTLVDSLV